MQPKKLSQPLQVRFDSLVTIDVVSILKDYIEGRSEVKYHQLLNLKNDPNVNVSNLGKKLDVGLQDYELRIFLFLGWIFTPDSSTSKQLYQSADSKS
jgi:hypothetical protein